MKERERRKKDEPSLTWMRQIVLEISHPQSEEFEEDGCRHFVGFQPNFYINMT